MILNPIIFFLAVLLVYAVAYPLQKNMRQKAAV
jgi:hypothetical protein